MRLVNDLVHLAPERHRSNLSGCWALGTVTMADEGPQNQFETLTAREREVFRLVAQHLRDKEIARLLELSPRTVHMHVLKARRRLSGMSRRDAALAFVAWEENRYGNDYHKQSPDLSVPHPNRSLGSRNEEQDEQFNDIAFDGLSGDLAVSGGSLGHDRKLSGAGASGARHRQRLTQGSGDGGLAVPAPAENSVRGGLHRGWIGRWRDFAERRRRDLTPLQWLALVGATAGGSSLLIATVMSAAHNFLYAIQRMREGWPPPPP